MIKVLFGVIFLPYLSFCSLSLSYEAKPKAHTNKVNHILHVLPQVVDIRGITVPDADCPADHPSRTAFNKKWMMYFTKNHGVTWPEGSRLVCVKQPAWSLYIRNTEENMERIDTWMKTMMQACSFPVNLSLIAFRKKDVDRLHRERGLSCNTLHALREAGKSKMVSTLSCTLQSKDSGEEFILKDTREINYPSEYCVVTSNTNQPFPSLLSMTPTNFIMREEGTTFQFIPEASSFPIYPFMFSFTCRFSHVALAEWKTYDAVTLLKSGKTIRTPCKQPIFNQMSDEGQCMIMPGETLLLGGGRTFDKDWVYYAFLTLDIVPAKKIVLE
jgi:hypothetical protein